LPTVRDARPGDAAAIARIHVTAWRETYRGLFPDAVLDGMDEAARRDLWARAIAQGTTRIAVAEGGFAQSGPQRIDAHRNAYPQELWCIYLQRIAQGRGLGRALFEHVCPEVPFTVAVFAANPGACAFYERMGGRCLSEAPEEVFGITLPERLYAFDHHSGE